ncbi:MAG: hypothetical protein ACRD4F_03495 [Candidatus Angelobacter sp.]
MTRSTSFAVRVVPGTIPDTLVIRTFFRVVSGVVPGEKMAVI